MGCIRKDNFRKWYSFCEHWDYDPEATVRLWFKNMIIVSKSQPNTSTVLDIKEFRIEVFCIANQYFESYCFLF